MERPEFVKESVNIMGSEIKRGMENTSLCVRHAGNIFCLLVDESEPWEAA